jgi:DNA repair exonuclease SbcCD ATPase subunit
MPVPQRGAVRSRIAQVNEHTRAGQELKKLHARLTELRNQAATNEGGEVHARLQQEIAGLHRQISERHWQVTGVVPGPGTPGSPNVPAPGTNPAGSGVPNIGGGAGTAYVDPPEAAALGRKATALQQAAAQLQQAGLAEQAAQLRKQAEMLEAQAEKMRVSMRKVFASANPGPLRDLQSSIRELQEQIQQLRKEIGELREQLQKARQ